MYIKTTRVIPGLFLFHVKHLHVIKLLLLLYKN